ncbi:MAG: aminoglycoside 6-adenylyltransferase [Treponemataceae bacterium]|nr:aminoglycoside 6-adenylyltransferase [Treponemataceae bacterium]
MEKFYDIKKRILEHAEKDADIKAIVAIGSSTRKNVKADEFSDLDLFVITSNVEKWHSGEYPKLFGKLNISFIEPTLGGEKEIRCIYDDDKDVDMIIFTSEHFEVLVKEGVAECVMNRGYDVLYDSMGCAELLEKHIKQGFSNPEISEAEFVNIVNDFYFHNIWASKKLKRGELWSAKMCVDSYLKNRLLKMLELYRYKSCGIDVWHDGRFLEKWAGDEIIEELKMCFARYDEKDVRNALIATCKLFEKISEELAAIEGFEYPAQAKNCAKVYLGI